MSGDLGGSDQVAAKQSRRLAKLGAVSRELRWAEATARGPTAARWAMAVWTGPVRPETEAERPSLRLRHVVSQSCRVAGSARLWMGLAKP